ncbi:hypothetical protein C8J57DRAFT_1537754 [Mycena rebaudengoi]|nr:hypothetical protein C8J57DRAFT_1537754 [Mycena rebaudengoi]
MYPSLFCYAVELQASSRHRLKCPQWVVSYYSWSPNGRTWTKLYVALLLLTDTTSTVLSVTWLYNLCIVNLPFKVNLSAYADANWMIAAGTASNVSTRAD